MYTISTAACVSILSLASVLGGVQAKLVNPSTPRPQCNRSYYAQKGDTCDTIASMFTLNMTYFQAINTDVNCNVPLNDTKPVCIGEVFPTCSNYQSATTTTCNGMASQWGLSIAKFVLYNNNVDDKCDNLVLDNSYCVAVQPT